MQILKWFQDRERISILLTIVAAILYSCSLLQAKFVIGYFGSIHSLPITFFVSLSLLTIASAILWVSPQPHGKLLGLQLGLFILALHLTMLAIGGIGASQTGASALYSFNGLAEYIFRTGHFNPPPPDLWPLNWPAAYILNAVIMLIIGTSDANLILTVNIYIWIPLMTSLVYLFLRSTIGKNNINHCIAGTWLFFVANWILYYLTSNVLGYMLFLLVLILLAMSLLQRSRGISSGYRICLILVLTIFPATHLLTALVVGIILLAIYVLKKAKVAVILMSVMILVIAIACWSIYITTVFFESRLPLFMEQLQSAFRLDMLWKFGVTERIVGTEAHQTMNILKLVSVALIGAVGFAGSVMVLKKRGNSDNDKFVLASLIGILITLFTISVAYTFETLQRVYFFTLPVIAYFGVKLLKFKISAAILTIILIVTLPLHFIALYGNALVDYVSPAAIRGVYFFNEHTDEGFLTGALVHFPLGKMANRENYQWVWLDRFRFEDNLLKHPIGYPNYVDHYVYLRPEDQEIYKFLGAGGDEHINEKSKLILDQLIQRIDSLTNCNLIYASPDLSIYAARSTLYIESEVGNPE